MTDRLHRVAARRASLSLAVAALAASACGCKGNTDSVQGTPPTPPPPAASSPLAVKSAVAASAQVAGPCVPADIGVSDAKVATLIPATIAGFCVLKKSEVRAWGDGTPRKIEDVSDLIDGYGETYAKDFFAKRYDSLKFVDGRGGAAEVDIALTTYDKPENAYALFTYLTVNNVDPDPEVAKRAGRRPPQKLAYGGAAALSSARALLWKGHYLVELTYNPDSSSTLAQATAAADTLLPQLVEAIAAKIVGTTDLPNDVRALPTEAEGRIPLGVEYVPAKYTRPEGKADSLKLAINGGYAIAYVREGQKRSRVLAVAREDRESARDAIDAFRKLPGWLPVKDKDLGDESVQFYFPVGAAGAGAAGKAEGVAVRKGTLVLALFDEELALGDPAQNAGYPRLSTDEKITKLKALLAAREKGLPGAPAPSAAPSASGSAH
ncbi:MAG: DUF6599 family protein [Polyangiales bacterium]